MTKEEFHSILRRLRDLHAPYFVPLKGRLVIKADWEDGTVNAFADRDWDRYIIEIFGGLARHPLLTSDGFALVACHEMGHHLGGAPTGLDLGWPSFEGQADYYATLKCIRRYFTGQDQRRELNRAFRQLAQPIDPRILSRCERAFRSEEERMICLRSALAGLSMATLMRALDRRGPQPDFATPDTRVVTRMETQHPEPQCRLDTYVAGAVCPVSAETNPDSKDHTKGVCFERREPDGYRPRCWYLPPPNAGRSRGR